MFRLLGRLGHVPPAKLALLLRTFVLLAWARSALAAVPVKKLIAQRARPVRDLGLSAPERSARLNDARWAVLVVARYSPIRFVCFPQCLAASALLRSAGIASRLHYGVRRTGQAARLETHTWLEADGQILIGGEVAQDFSELAID